MLKFHPQKALQGMAPELTNTPEAKEGWNCK